MSDAFSDKDLAAQVAARFSALMIRECFSTDAENPELQFRLQEGLKKTGLEDEAMELTGRLTLTQDDDARVATIDTGYMLNNPEACIALSEIFAGALEASYGSVNRAMFDGNMYFERDNRVSQALSRNRAPTFSQFFKPVLN